eukprot:9500208-Pyramimonas_sp.AAC.1
MLLLRWPSNRQVVLRAPRAVEALVALVRPGVAWGLVHSVACALRALLGAPVPANQERLPKEDNRDLSGVLINLFAVPVRNPKTSSPVASDAFNRCYYAGH